VRKLRLLAGTTWECTRFAGALVRRPLALFAAAALAAGASAAPASAQNVAQLHAQLAGQMALAGPQSSAYVYDLDAGQVLFSSRADAVRPPASVEKLYTATTALERAGPGARLSTTVLGSGSLAPGGLWQGNLYLRGGGDPTFGSSAFIHAHYGGLGASVSTLVTQLTRGAGIRAVAGSVVGDESYLDALRGEPSSGFAFDPFLEGNLSALTFNRGEVRNQRGPHAPAAYAARQLWAALRRAGVRIAGPVRTGATPAAATPLAAVGSPTLAQLLGLMLPSSDNFFAETLLKDLGARFGAGGSTAAGAAVVRQTIAADFGLRPQVVDGSGLSRADRTSALQVVSLLQTLASTRIGAVLRSDLAVAGRTGTLAHRMRSSAAAGRCQAKTGTLIGASNLAGYCRSASGHTLAFALLDDGIEVELAHAVQDRMAIAIAGY
jgi:D-alanyl-D-alanine carboxypeptidase/D-alanyl-D-alanine-endopeptidase (penicillin-binding protein 4)